MINLSDLKKKIRAIILTEAKKYNLSRQNNEINGHNLNEFIRLEYNWK